MEFIMDRTYEDVQEIIDMAKRGWLDFSEEEKEKWLAGMKGALNYTDLNRMASNINEIKQMLDSVVSGGIETNIESKTDWLVTDIPTQGALQSFFIDSCNEIIKYLPLDFADTETFNSATIEKLNAFENLLYKANTITNALQNYGRYENDIVWNEVVQSAFTTKRQRMGLLSMTAVLPVGSYLTVLRYNSMSESAAPTILGTYSATDESNATFSFVGSDTLFYSFSSNSDKIKIYTTRRLN